LIFGLADFVGLDLDTFFDFLLVLLLVFLDPFFCLVFLFCFVALEEGGRDELALFILGGCGYVDGYPYGGCGYGGYGA
jgi:hypothetical protein